MANFARVKELKMINVTSDDNCLFGNVSTIIYGKNSSSPENMKEQCAEFMKNNNEYYSELIVMDEQPAEVLMGLAKSNYMPFLDHWS
jgi:hypothetical protein